MVNGKVLFGLGLESGCDQVEVILRHARAADEARLDFFSVGDHPYFADRVDAYATLGFVLGATKTIGGTVICTNLLSRPAPILARTIAGLSVLSGDRVVLVVGAGGNWDEIIALGVPRLSPGARIRALEEAIVLTRALTGGGDPITFEGEFYQVYDLAPTVAPTPPIWVGCGGPKGLAVTGRHADGWIPPHAADWRSTLVAQSRLLIDEAATSVDKDPREVGTIYNVAGPIARDPVPSSQTRTDTGRWNGGGVIQWIEELSYAVLDCGATAFNYVVPPGGAELDDTTLKLWAYEVVPAVREVTSHR
ncbi:LLM class flavin-dependent oxidoreductase [Mycobacterium sp. E1747]|uniref:LLM class flavin-dependent oxidoreductase n=1 Tax=Mycobacterium sp. E1747 TaxID=1834128 RepID=UPI000800F97B|nr:LLM class flavin-dependent oxidoreductase [Mycobacterium sp. E1747]OBH13067.1 5,10-methylene tetrahydromethanopterin reductase [Mycobacterium sp. E1747]